MAKKILTVLGTIRFNIYSRKPIKLEAKMRIRKNYWHSLGPEGRFDASGAGYLFKKIPAEAGISANEAN
jgi:hypothetical protein